MLLLLKNKCPVAKGKLPCYDQALSKYGARKPTAKRHKNSNISTGPKLFWWVENQLPVQWATTVRKPTRERTSILKRASSNNKEHPEKENKIPRCSVEQKGMAIRMAL